ncbi:MAG: hypothetical protein ACKO7M_04235, partial [Acinetobacter junii]
MKPTARTCNKEVQKFTNTSYDILLEIYNNTNFFKDLYETLNPAYYVDFTAGLDGWAATEGTGTLSYNSGITTSFGGDFYKNNLNIDAEKNKFIVLMFELVTPVNISGSVELTYADGTTFDYVNTINYVNGVTGTIINLEQNPNHKGTVTGIRFKLGSNPGREYRLFKSFVGKPLLSINNLVNLESEILNLISRQNLTDSILTALNSRTDALEEKPFLSLKPETLGEDFDKYEVTGISVNGVNKKVIFKDDVIELVNSNGSSYFKLNISDNTYEFKGRLVLADGTIVDDISDIRALDGDYQEFRFTRSNTQPSIESNNPVPPNYSLTPPAGNEPIWFTISKKTSTGALISSWSTPAKLTGENGTSGVAPDTVLAYLTSENYIAISNSDGTNPNLSAAGGEFVLTKNSVKVTSGVTYSGGVTKNGLSLVINPSNGLFNLSGSNWTTDVEFFDLTATFEGKNYTKRYSVVKQKSSGGGGGGTNTLTLLLYKSTVRAATSLAGPSGPVTFNLSTLSLSEDSADALNGWSLLVPEDTLPKRWVTQALITTTASTIQIQPSQWSTPRVFSIDGVDGEDGSGTGEGLDGFSRATVYAYKAAETIAANDTPGDAVYTFATGVATLANGWQSSIPTSALPVWVRTGLAISRDAADTINTNEWSDAVKITGASLNTAQLFIYKRTASSTPPDANDKPTVSASYDFQTGILSGLNGGWTNIPPLSSGKYLWVRAAMASSTTLTDNIAPTEWSEPRLLASDGSDGSGGSGEAYPGAERKGGTYSSFNWNTTGGDNANARWGTLTGRSP